MDLDRESIERRDFPIGRRGYEKAAVDAHLRTLAADVEELESALAERGRETLSSAAAGQVQSILEKAETTAADIERQAAEQSAATRREADDDAQRTRGDAIARAQKHVQAVSQATAALLEKVESMDQEVGALVQGLRAGGERLASDLCAVEANMGELYDGGAAPDEREPVPAAAVQPPPVVSPAASPSETRTAAPTATNGASEQPLPPVPPASGLASGGEADLDGARLIALNMALNGEPREQADRYLADNFDLPDRDKLLDEVYAAIEG